MPTYPEVRASWLPPKDPSVFESPITKAIRILAGLVGADDPAGTMMSLAGPLALPAMAAQKSASPLAQKVIKAFHGSPHDFDQFSMAKIGTGEGAQAQGHGLYFAEKEEVAQTYRDVLTKDGANGRVYEVEIGADPDAFLDLETPLNQQPAAVQETMREAVEYLKAKPINPVVRKKLEDGTAKGRELYLWLSGERTLDEARVTWPNVPKRPNAVGSKYLNEQGLPGLTYLDQGSRTAQGLMPAAEAVAPRTRNYVVFDDKLVSIVKKYVAAGMTFGEAMRLAQQDLGQEPIQ